MISLDLKFGRNEKQNLEFSPDYKKLIEESCKILIQVLNTEAFKEEVLNFSWKPRLRRRQYNFNHTKLSRATVFKKIMSGDDKFIDENPDDSNAKGDKDIDIHISPYKDKKDYVKGGTYTTTFYSHLNLTHWDKVLERNKDKLYLVKASIAKHIIHEYCHNLGFKHKGNNPSKNNNKYSVPYAVGDIVEDLILEVEPEIANIKDEESYEALLANINSFEYESLSHLNDDDEQVHSA